MIVRSSITRNLSLTGVIAGNARCSAPIATFNPTAISQAVPGPYEIEPAHEVECVKKPCSGEVIPKRVDAMAKKLRSNGHCVSQEDSVIDAQEVDEP